MPNEILALIDKPMLLAIVLAVGAAIGVGAERIVEGWKRAERRERWQKRGGKRAWGGGKAKVVPVAPTPKPASPDRRRAIARRDGGSVHRAAIVQSG